MNLASSISANMHFQKQVTVKLSPVASSLHVQALKWLKLQCTSTCSSTKNTTHSAQHYMHVMLGDYLHVRILECLQVRDATIYHHHQINSHGSWQCSFHSIPAHPIVQVLTSTPKLTITTRTLYMYMRMYTVGLTSGHDFVHTCLAEKRTCCIRWSHRAVLLVLLASPGSPVSALPVQRGGSWQTWAGRWAPVHWWGLASSYTSPEPSQRIHTILVTHTHKQHTCTCTSTGHI